MPASPPLTVVSRLHFDESCAKCIMILLVTMDTRAPAEHEMIVLVQARPIAAASPAFDILAWEPALNAKNPNSRMNAPVAAS